LNLAGPEYIVWMRIMVLHIWILNVRLRIEDQKFSDSYEQKIIDYYWKDIEDGLMNEAKVQHPVIALKYSKEHALNYKGYMAAFDIGLYDGDAMLAEAIWRNMYEMKEDVPIEEIGEIVRYIRREIHNLHQLDRNTIERGVLNWGPPPFCTNSDVQEEKTETIPGNSSDLENEKFLNEIISIFKQYRIPERIPLARERLLQLEKEIPPELRDPGPSFVDEILKQ